MVLDKLRAKFHIRKELARAVLAEFTGTFLLCLIGLSVVAQKVLPRPEVNEFIGVNVGFGIAIVFGVAVSAKLSGGHINPAVSLAFLTVGQITVVQFIAYFFAQFLGAFFGAAVVYAVYNDAINVFDGGVRTVGGPKDTAGIFASYPGPHLGLLNGFVDQFVATAVFVFLIAHIVDKRNSYPTWLQPILVGTGFVAIGAAFGYNCGYPVNPARDLAPRLFTALFYGGAVFTKWFWIPVVGPFVGAVVGIWLYYFLIGFHTPQDAEEKYVVLTGNQELKPLTAKDATEEVA
ncbi:hypothetical protein CAEBREN_22859 [Caenorhabditis brenneri]|uniref:Uncharacterized protein n=1 Tax=Caenorhabditis brenneri TaxID=135651 RepID=G0NE95_CAEBE|nr:hypothetical protein CAEBREN_22859 [Caenorhabditis brenneri]